MNQKFKTLILWALPILLVIALSYQFLSSSNVDSLKSNGTTIAPRNSAVARVSYGRFLDYINSGRVTSVDIFEDIKDGKGPKDYKLILGYAGWEAGQIEKDLEAVQLRRRLGEVYRTSLVDRSIPPASRPIPPAVVQTEISAVRDEEIVPEEDSAKASAVESPGGSAAVSSRVENGV